MRRQYEFQAISITRQYQLLGNSYHEAIPIAMQNELQGNMNPKEYQFQGNSNHEAIPITRQN